MFWYKFQTNFQAALTPEQIAKITATKEACVKETSVSEQLLQDAKNGKFADDSKLKAFSVCVAKKIGFVKASGEIDHAVLKAKSEAVLGDKALANKLDADCAVTKGTVEDTVFETVKCYYDKSGKHLTLI